MPPTSLADLAALAERTLGHLEGDGQVLAVLEDGGLAVTLTAVRAERAAQAQVAGDDDAHLARAARAAGLQARRMRAWAAPPLPRPARVPSPAPDPPAAADAHPSVAHDLHLDRHAGTAHVAVASTAGVRAAQTRRWTVARLCGSGPGGRTAHVSVAGAADLGAVAAEVRALLGVGPDGGPFGPHVAAGGARPWPGGDPGAVVLGPEAVAVLLDRLRPAFGVDAALGAAPLGGWRAAEAVSLADDAADPATLGRAFDAEGVPRERVVLLDAGAPVGVVHDSASAARAGARSTGHATRPLTLAPMPEQLLLAGGEASGVAELAAGVASGLHVPALTAARPHRTVGAARIEDGALTVPVAPLELELDPLEVLAAVTGLTTARRLVVLRGHCPGGPGSATVPALRTTAGVRVAA